MDEDPKTLEEALLKIKDWRESWMYMADEKQTINAELARIIAERDEYRAAIRIAVLITLRQYWPMGDESQYAATAQQIVAEALSGQKGE